MHNGIESSWLIHVPDVFFINYQLQTQRYLANSSFPFLQFVYENYEILVMKTT